MNGKAFDNDFDGASNGGFRGSSICIDNKVHVLTSEDWYDVLNTGEFVNRSETIEVVPCDGSCPADRSLLQDEEVPPEVEWAVNELFKREEEGYPESELQIEITSGVQYKLVPQIPSLEEVEIISRLMTV